MSLSSFVIKVVRRGRSISSSDFKDFSFHSKEAVPKTRLDASPVHSSIVPYTFEAEPPEGRTVIMEFDHGYEYTPGTIFLISFDKKVFHMMPFIQIFFQFEPTSDQIFFGYADKKKVYIYLRRTGDEWPPLKGSTVYIKYRILDVVGMDLGA